MDLVDRLGQTYTGVVHDVMRAMGLRDFTLPPEIRPLFPGQTLAGVAATVSGKVDDRASAHQTLLGWTGLLSKARANTVLICQPNDSTVAHMGELSAETLKLKGVRGYVADGGCRDVDFILRLGFPVWCRYFTPRDIVGHWLPDQFDRPITIAPVTIHPGDLVLGDRDGMVILPGAQAEEIVAGAETAIVTENLVRKAVLEGVDPQEAYLKFGKF
ncbi:MAG TPA: RraA family protein [Geminicoccaceae bacterium]|nr:RraA family protein [Geminicoccaceae bacterium]